MRKADCTPEQWADYLRRCKEYRYNNLEATRARLREYAQRPEVKERRKAHDAKPEILAKRRVYAKTDEAKDKAREAKQKHRNENPEVWVAKLAAQREKRTGFSPALYDQTFQRQNGLCAVCQRELGVTHRACADHCHDTKKPRGILCHHCNILEGMLRGAALTPEKWAKRMTDYLANPPAQVAE